MQHIATFYPLPPYNFLQTVQVSRFYSVMGAVREGVYRRAVAVGDAIALVQVEGVGTIDAPRLEAYILASTAPVDLSVLRETLARMLAVNVDLAPFFAMAQKHPALWRVVEPLYGLHILQTQTVFEAMLMTITEQQIALSAAQRAERWLAEWSGRQIRYEGEIYPLFPSAAQVAAASLEVLTPLKITFRRMQTMMYLARLECRNSFDGLRHQSTDEIYRGLIALKGIGHWTAAWIMTRSLGHPIYMGSADVALRAAVNHYFYGESGRAAPELTDAAFAPYGDDAGLAAFYTLTRWALERYAHL